MTPERSILLVEDDERLCHSLSFTLRRNGYSVAVAATGSAGLDCAREAHRRGNFFSLLITDLQLPGIDGFELITVVRAFAPALPVIVITGLGNSEVREKLSRLSVSGTLDKPFSAEELAGRVREVLPEHR
jgi:two-component system, NtrC family, C4-dicarboxylate transport response regulator DctD